MSKSFSEKQLTFINAAYCSAFDVSNVDRHDLQEIADQAGVAFPQWLTTTPDYKVGRGRYRVPTANEKAGTRKVWGKKAPARKNPVKAVKAPVTVAAIVAAAAAVAAPVPVENNTVQLSKGAMSGVAHVPETMSGYVPFGYFKDVFNIIKSNRFFPVFVTGLSGNGKTLMVDQACAKAGRDLYRVNITIETDEDDLIGGFRLVDGATVWFDGPVVEAMKKGGVLLLDEVDLGSTKLMCLQPVLEGKGIYIKKINEWVKPAAGFTILATANTKGKGDETGNFIGTGILNEAFLERFPITIEQEYPSVATEKKILKADFAKHGIDDDDFIGKLVDWADLTRKAAEAGTLDSFISTRRLVHISEAYAIFNDRLRAIELCIARFDDLTRESFIETYTKLDADVTVTKELEGTESADTDNNCPF